MTPTTAEKLETAMCIWEWCINAESKLLREPLWHASRAEIAITEAIENEGHCEIRSRCARLVDDCEIIWKTVKETGFEGPFDWDFVPWFMSNCVDFKNNWETIT
tara:strand:- start:511 stop:822 length:312 start_codon:yes stop_codon:yes gene_type:complete